MACRLNQCRIESEAQLEAETEEDLYSFHDFEIDANLNENNKIAVTGMDNKSTT